MHLFPGFFLVLLLVVLTFAGFCTAQSKDVQLKSIIQDYELLCKLHGTTSNQTSGYVVGPVDIAAVGEDWRLGRIDVDTGGISLIGNATFPYFQHGATAADPINNRFHIKQEGQLYTVSLLTGETLYVVPCKPELKNLAMDLATGELYAMAWNQTEGQEYLLRVDYTTGATSVVAKPDSKFVMNYNRGIDVEGRFYYYTGSYNDNLQRLFKIDLATGTTTNVLVPQLIASLFPSGYTKSEFYYALSRYSSSENFAYTKLDLKSGGVSVVDETMSESYPGLFLSDRAYDSTAKRLVGFMVDSYILNVVDMATGKKVKSLEYPRHYRFGPLTFQHLCTCCVVKKLSQRATRSGTAVIDGLVANTQCTKEEEKEEGQKTSATSPRSHGAVSSVMMVAALVLALVFRA